MEDIVVCVVVDHELYATFLSIVLTDHFLHFAGIQRPYLHSSNGKILYMQIQAAITVLMRLRAQDVDTSPKLIQLRQYLLSTLLSDTPCGTELCGPQTPKSIKERDSNV